jgi:hypothetical protein
MKNVAGRAGAKSKVAPARETEPRYIYGTGGHPSDRHLGHNRRQNVEGAENKPKRQQVET